MVSNGGIFFFVHYYFQEHLETFVQLLMEFMIAFVLLRNHCLFLSIRKATAVRTLCTRVLIFSEEETKVLP